MNIAHTTSYVFMRMSLNRRVHMIYPAFWISQYNTLSPSFVIYSWWNCTIFYTREKNFCEHPCFLKIQRYMLAEKRNYSTATYVSWWTISSLSTTICSFLVIVLSELSLLFGILYGFWLAAYTRRYCSSIPQSLWLSSIAWMSNMEPTWYLWLKPIWNWKHSRNIECAKSQHAGQAVVSGFLHNYKIWLHT